MAPNPENFVYAHTVWNSIYRKPRFYYLFSTLLIINFIFLNTNLIFNMTNP